MKDDEVLIARLEDKINQAADRYMVTSGDFLDTHQRKISEDYCKTHKLPIRVVFYGGYPDAERCIPVCLPDYIDFNEDTSAIEELKELLTVVRVSIPKGSRKLTHRDYLGSLLALGLDREVAGDILVRDEEIDGLPVGADIIVKAEIAEFILLNYDKAGRTNLKAELLPIDELKVVEADITEKFDTVASLRLDSLTATAFGLSRAKAAEAIRRGIVSVNNIETLKTDMEIHEKDKVVMRGKGKFVLSEIGDRTRKDRIRIKIALYGKN